jgi:YadA head domain repeat (2 copies)/YadA-like membrane anchor domain
MTFRLSYFVGVLCSTALSFALTMFVATPKAQAQFVCGGTGTGGEPQTGDGATAGLFSVACGTDADAVSGSTAVGVDATATGDLSTALGRGATADAISAVAVGNSTNSMDPAGKYSTAIGTGASASGENSVAVGSGQTISESAQAVGANSTAVGAGAIAGGFVFLGTFANDGTTALGSEARAGAGAAGQVNATAVGFQATANAANATAIGQGATASGNNSTATGFASTASGLSGAAYGANSTASGNGSSAYGVASTASATGSSAFGIGSTASFTGSTAIGAGASTTASNQIMLGTASATYAAPGIKSAASLAAQSGTTFLVTSDSAGHLATSNFNPQSITALQSDVASLQSQVVNLNGDIKRSYEGTAIAIALGGSTLPDNKRFAISANWGGFRGENAAGFTGLLRLNEDWVANGGVGFGFGRGGVGGRAGVTYSR